MKKKLLIMALAIISVQSIQAQLNPLKKKNKEEKQAADSLATNKDGEERRKRKAGAFFRKWWVRYPRERAIWLAQLRVW